VEEAVDDGSGDNAVSKDLAPIAEAAVGGEHDGGLLVRRLTTSKIQFAEAWSSGR
jgi:hypothetical protein